MSGTRRATETIRASHQFCQTPKATHPMARAEMKRAWASARARPGMVSRRTATQPNRGESKDGPDCAELEHDLQGCAMRVQRHERATCVAGIRVQRADMARSVESPSQQRLLGDPLDREIPYFHAVLGRCYQPVGPLPPLTVHFFRRERHADEDQDACGNRDHESRLAMTENQQHGDDACDKTQRRRRAFQKKRSDPQQNRDTRAFQPRPLDQR